MTDEWDLPPPAPMTTSVDSAIHSGTGSRSNSSSPIPPGLNRSLLRYATPHTPHSTTFGNPSYESTPKYSSTKNVLPRPSNPPVRSPSHKSTPKFSPKNVLPRTPNVSAKVLPHTPHSSTNFPRHTSNLSANILPRTPKSVTGVLPHTPSSLSGALPRRVVPFGWQDIWVSQFRVANSPPSPLVSVANVMQNTGNGVNVEGGAQNISNSNDTSPSLDSALEMSDRMFESCSEPFSPQE